MERALAAEAEAARYRALLQQLADHNYAPDFIAQVRDALVAPPRCEFCTDLVADHTPDELESCQTDLRVAAVVDAFRDNGELVKAATSYLIRYDGFNTPKWGPPQRWPWNDLWWKPSTDPIRNLEKAGALIAAEIDRLGAVPAPKEET